MGVVSPRSLFSAILSTCTFEEIDFFFFLLRIQANWSCRMSHSLKWSDCFLMVRLQLNQPCQEICTGILAWLLLRHIQRPKHPCWVWFLSWDDDHRTPPKSRWTFSVYMLSTTRVVRGVCRNSLSSSGLSSDGLVSTWSLHEYYRGLQMAIFYSTLPPIITWYCRLVLSPPIKERAYQLNYIDVIKHMS